MENRPEKPLSESDADALDGELQSLWRGQPSLFDRLLDGVTAAPLAALRNVTAAAAALNRAESSDVHGHPIVPGYRILGHLGRGGMGDVYEAQPASGGRRVAVKIMRADADSARRAAQFESEIRTLARLAHPNIAAIHAAGATTDGRPFFALELVRGAPLLDYANARNAARGQLPLSLRQRVRLFCQVCEAMHYAHQRGVVHLDLKPSNILVDTLGRPKILDFGIAAILDASRGAKTGPERAAGTLRYMSPEQARGDVAAISHRSDIYALGLIVYELLTGRRPYQVNRYLPDEARRNICEAPILPPSHVNHAVPTALDDCVLRALDRDPQRRHTSAGAFAELVVERVLTQPRDRDDISRFLAQLYNRK